MHTYTRKSTHRRGRVVYTWLVMRSVLSYSKEMFMCIIYRGAAFTHKILKERHWELATDALKIHLHPNMDYFLPICNTKDFVLMHIQMKPSLQDSQMSLLPLTFSWLHWEISTHPHLLFFLLHSQLFKQLMVLKPSLFRKCYMPNVKTTQKISAKRHCLNNWINPKFSNLYF